MQTVVNFILSYQGPLSTPVNCSNSQAQFEVSPLQAKSFMSASGSRPPSPFPSAFLRSRNQWLFKYCRQQGKSHLRNRNGIEAISPSSVSFCLGPDILFSSQLSIDGSNRQCLQTAIVGYVFGVRNTNPSMAWTKKCMKRALYRRSPWTRGHIVKALLCSV